MKMRKIRTYKQHTPETCGISCLMMALDYFGIDYPTMGKEHRLYQDYKTKVKSAPHASLGTSGAAIACALVRRGLDVTLAHSSEKLLENRDGYYPETLYGELLESYHGYIDRAGERLCVRTGVEISCAALRRELAAGRLIILQCFVEGNADGMHDHVLHGILIYDADENCFYACDPWPSQGKVVLTDAELEARMETPVGRMYIAAGKRASV